jgi:putative pyruvate formate lyase activating enzyme
MMADRTHGPGANCSHEPAYLALHRRGELLARAREALDSLQACTCCPRACEADRLSEPSGVCQTGRYARVSSYFPHHGEEDCLRGWGGSGTIFFTRCNLRCVFCQNYDISHIAPGVEVPPTRLAEMMLELQAAGCHNINWVTPSHVVPQLLEALTLAAEAGLRLPIVYNTSAYDALETLQWLDGVVDIYMPDFKIWAPENAHRYLTARDYPAAARLALLEMHRQVGDLTFDSHGLAVRGVLVRHLVMPGQVAGTRQILQFLAGELSTHTYVNVMAQYRPAGKVSRSRFGEINRGVSREEYDSAVSLATELGLRLDQRHSLARWVGHKGA